jgi:rSAM/selenodomain-associated transferase 2
MRNGFKVTVIIPTLNEAATIAATITSAQSASDVEVIIADGGSRDDTVERARSCGAQVLSTSAGRAEQMNAGATAAKGDILLFLHADTCLPERFDECVREALSRPDVVAGAFRLRFDSPRWGLRVIEWLANWRSTRLHMPYGDQAIFLRAETFHDIGGFPDIPVMEDFELMRRLRRRGRIRIAPVSVVTSARRWTERGVLKTTLINQAMIIAYLLGVSPSRLARWYYGNQSALCTNSRDDEDLKQNLKEKWL